MSDLISRQSLIDALNKFAPEHYTALVNSIIMKEPSAERKGKWLRYGEDGNPNTEDTAIWQCDHCLETYYGRTTRIPKYCPNCGARMVSEDD